MYTPKIKERTVIPVFYALIEFLMLLDLIFDCFIDIYFGLHKAIIFPVINAILFWYALPYFIGFDILFQDGINALFQTPKRDECKRNYTE